MGVAVGTEKAICKNLSSMAHNLFKKDITWFKVRKITWFKVGRNHLVQGERAKNENRLKIYCA